jgi:SPP1 family phage portal protein
MQFGRTKIKTAVEYVDESNVLTVLESAMNDHISNCGDIEYLYNYFKGQQPVLQRKKEIRPEICNKIVENIANEIVSFKTGYLLGEPIQYVSRSDTDTSKEVGELNDIMELCSKACVDNDIAEWLYICGVGYRLVLPNDAAILGKAVPALSVGEKPDLGDDTPFTVYCLDPRGAFVVHYSGVGEKPVMGVKYVKKDDLTVVFSVWTGSEYFEIESAGVNGTGRIVKHEKNTVGYIPVVEYVLNNARQGAFEIVLPLLDAINDTQSDRLDGVDQFIQSLMVLYNAEIDEDKAKNLRDAGLIILKSFGENKADIKVLNEQLNQTQTQTLIDDLYQKVLEIVGMPNRNGGTSTSDTGAAVIVRDGWSTAEARAKSDEANFKRSEREFLKIALSIIKRSGGLSLMLKDVDIKFTRHNYDNIQSKSQVLVSMLNNSHIHPALAFEHCGLFSDPQSAFNMSEAYHQEQMKKWEPVEVDSDENDDLQQTGQGDSDSQEQSQEGV